MLTTLARTCVAVIAGASLAVGGALAATVPALAAGTTYYVATTGDDGNDGISEATAFATIDKAIQTAADGDTVSVGAGSFTGGTVNKDITLEGDGTTTITQTVIINAGGEGSTVTGFHFTRMDNNQIWAVGLDGSDETTITGNHFDQPTGPGQLDSILNSVASGVTISDNVFVGDQSNCDAVAVNLIGGSAGLDDVVITGNTASEYGNFVVANANEVGGLTNLVVSDNVVTDSLCSAIFLGDAVDGVDVTGNLISGGLASGVSFSSFTGSIQKGGTHDVVVNDNTFVGNLYAISLIPASINSTLDASGNAYFANGNGIRNNTVRTADATQGTWAIAAGPAGSGADSSTGTGVTSVLPVATSFGTAYPGATSSTTGLVSTVHLGAGAANGWFAVGGYGAPSTFDYVQADASGDVTVTWPATSTSGAHKVAIVPGGFSTRQYVDVTIPAAAFTSSPTPSISGHANVGRTLTAITRTWTPTATLALQWNADGVAIPGATANTLVLAPAQFGKKITLTVSATLSGSAPTIKTSAPTAAVAASPFASAPIPAVTGSRTVGAVLTAVPGAWNPAATLAYHWARDGKIIAGATSSTYTQTAADKNHRIQVIVTGSATGYTTKSVRSATPAKTGAVLVTLPTSVAVPSTARVGVRMGVTTTGSWQSGAKLTYQWRANGTAIKNATSATYVPVASDIGKVITVTVYGSKAGYSTNRISSGPSAATLIGAWATVGAPTIYTAKVGKASSVSSYGTWSPKPSAYRYQWLLDGNPIVGATKTTYTPAPSMVGKSLVLRITAIRSGYPNTVVDTAARVIAPAAFTTTVKPKITGTARVGRVLTATTPGWAPAATGLSYQWKLNGVAITGAVDDIYTVATEDLGGRLTVTVTGTRLGYATTSVTSSATAVVTP